MDASIETQATATEAIMTEVGFQAVSRWIAADDDGEAFVFRKFDRLAARNLLYLQARMLALEERINKIDGAAGSMDMLQVLRNWEMLVAKSEDSKVHIEAREKMKKQIDLHEELQKTIKEYPDACDEWFWRADEALDLQSRIANFSGPSRRVLGAYRGWLESSNNLKGLSSRFLDDKQDLSVTSANDAGNIARFREKSLARWANIISTLVAVALLVGSIVGLYFVADLKIKFIMIAVFAAFFALSLGVITNARRPEVFAATAA
ncbi:hypothetical protein OOU_Y34scaffold00574g4 [Pyricularia oryzae Y34]|uniref:DUF6594 domain-containing protein n=1 Tax=Pyricularia oryzae (strain Y34) TaxID=1143189 RepID=A0AA97PKB6_PYRO3|nr:hypothetical protein OOU_Y34scaffold00574g4 [Pyricularia oryzae Y34]